MASCFRQAMMVVSSQEHWSHFLSVLGPLASDPLGSKRACHVTVGGRSISFYHAALEEEEEEKDGHPDGAHTFLLLIRGGHYSGGDRSLMRALVSSFGAEALERLAVVSLDDSKVGGTPDRDLLELLDACQGRYCRMTSSTASDGLDVLLHLLHFMPSEPYHSARARKSSSSSGNDVKTLRQQEVQAEKRQQEQEQEQRRADKHTVERQQVEEAVKRNHRARLQKQLSIIPDEKKISVVLLGVSGSGKTSALTLIAQQAACHPGTCAAPQPWPCLKPTYCCQRTKVTWGDVEGRLGRQLVLVDTPELWDEDGREVVELVRDCLALALPGPHVFLLVLQLGRFTQAESHMLGHLQKIFGRDFAERALVLFVQQQQQQQQQGPQLEPQQQQQGACDYVCGAHASLQALVRCCGARFHQLTIHHGGIGGQSAQQVRELLDAVERLVAAHGGRPLPGKKFSVAVLQKRRQAMKEGAIGVLEGNCLLTES